MAGAAVDGLRGEVAARLGRDRLQHVEAVADTAAEIAARGGWPPAVRDAALRAAWIHDALKEPRDPHRDETGADPIAEWVRTIRSAGEEPDPWSLAHAPHLLHAPAAAVWAAARGERDREVLDAVRHHPTGHPSWGSVGRILYVADFCEPTRPFAGPLDTARWRARAGEGEEGLREASRRVLALRLAWLVERGRAVHPSSWETWNAWVLGDPSGEGAAPETSHPEGSP